MTNDVHVNDQRRQYNVNDEQSTINQQRRTTTQAKPTTSINVDGERRSAASLPTHSLTAHSLPSPTHCQSLSHSLSYIHSLSVTHFRRHFAWQVTCLESRSLGMPLPSCNVLQLQHKTFVETPGMEPLTSILPDTKR